MTDTSVPAPATSASHPQTEELAALVAEVTGLGQMSLAITTHCVEIQTQIPLLFMQPPRQISV
ncbi:hypothetical protein B0H17DRAFT_1193302 [Mycena rosella]|uniref:Uncharacterized protein n=1 Tax=Mycena rosella TaxID=1033263 RepID=A0AAD7GT90_MYCRO|nr:hypothetical protein B0H17DRAFT_1193302 [Mycena rosella]